MTTKQQTDKSITTTTTKRTYNAPKGTKITGVEMLDNGGMLVTFDKDEVKGERFKNGDVVYHDGRIMVVNSYPSLYHVLIYPIINNDLIYDVSYGFDFSTPSFRLATPTEQQVLFDALAKDGKRWNANTLEIEDIKEEFKRGDILASGDALLIFDEYATYNKEKDMLHSLWNNVGPYGRTYNNNWTTKYFKHATDEQKAQVHELLREQGRKWNAETLEVEDIKPEFKRGDIVIYDNTSRVAIFDEYVNSTNKKDFKDITAMMNISNGKYVDVTFNKQWNTDTLRMATDNEAKLLFDLLKSIGKKWNRDTLEIEELEIEELDISEIVVGWLSACEYLNKPMPKNYVYEPNSDFEKQINAQIELQMIREAWNRFDGFVVDFKDNLQAKHYPQVHVLDKCRIRLSNWMTYASIDTSCYSFKTIERALQFGNQFKELFKTAMGIE